MDAADSECAICFEDILGRTCLPCGHNAFCAPCAAKLKECPLCRTAIEQQPEPLLLHFAMINGKRWDTTVTQMKRWVG
jgi:hypothetical protein